MKTSTTGEPSLFKKTFWKSILGIIYCAILY